MYQRWSLEWWLSRVGTVIAVIGSILFVFCMLYAFLGAFWILYMGPL